MNIKKETNSNGKTVFKLNLYLGKDCYTGKQIRRKIIGKTKKEVEKKAYLKRKEFETNGNTLHTIEQEMTFEEVANIWLDRYKKEVKTNSYLQMVGQMNAYILPKFKDYKMNMITPKIIQKAVLKWERKANKGEMMKNIKLLVNILDRIFRLALSLNEIEVNPVSNVLVSKVKTNSRKEIKHLTREEVKRFLNVLDTQNEDYLTRILAILCRVSLATGIRVSEGLALQWSDIDFNECSISISKGLDRYGKLQPTPKTKSSNRVVMVDNDTMKLLKSWKIFQAETMFERGSKATLVFGKMDNTYYHRSFLLKHLQVLFARADISDVGFHGLRHTHASLLVNNHVPYKEISERLGHKSVALTIDVYSHLEDKNKKEVANVFETIVSNL